MVKKSSLVCVTLVLWCVYQQDGGGQFVCLLSVNVFRPLFLAVWVLPECLRGSVRSMVQARFARHRPRMPCMLHSTLVLMCGGAWVTLRVPHIPFHSPLPAGGAQRTDATLAVTINQHTHRTLERAVASCVACVCAYSYVCAASRPGRAVEEKRAAHKCSSPRYVSRVASSSFFSVLRTS